MSCVTCHKSTKIITYKNKFDKVLKLVGGGSVSIINKLWQTIGVQTKLQDLSVPWQGKIILMDGRIRKLSKEEEKCSIIFVLSFVEEALF